MLPETRPAELTAGRFAALFAAAFAIAAGPLLWVTLPPLVDYPNHLARMHIIAAGASSPILRTFYTITWRPLPDLAMDLVVPLLARAMPLLWAGKAFLLLTFLLLAGGTALLHHALFRRWSAWPCLAFLLLYSRSLLWGFANFLFGVGLALVGAAAWVRLRDGPAALRHSVAALFALAIYISHLFAFGAYALLIVGYEVAALRQERRLVTLGGLRALAATAAQFVLPALLFLAAGHGGGTGAVVYSRFFRKFDLFFSILDNYVRWFDVASFVLLVLLFGIGAWRGAIALRRGMGLPLLVLLLAQLAMPNRILGAAGVDHRMPLVLALVLVAGTQGLAAPPRLRRAIGAGLAFLFLVRMAVIAAVWTESDRAYAPLVQALAALPPGSKVAVGYPPGAVNVSNRHPPTIHLAGLAVIGADAFVPTLFAYPGQQPLSLKPRCAALAAAASPDDFWAMLVEGRRDPDGHVAAALTRYDFVLLAGNGPFRPQPDAPLALRAAGAGAQLYAILPRSAQRRGDCTIGG